MKNKWRAGFLAASLGIAGVLAGCSSDGENSSSGDSSKDVKIDIFQFKVEFKDQFEAVAEAYEKENEGVDINITTVGGGEDYG
ncbi:MAG: carbohydrate ABC transporter substrate-binding protein, partial [Psychrobacillus psychrotolerans]